MSRLPLRFRPGGRSSISAAALGSTAWKEFHEAGFAEATILRTTRNARTKNRRVLAAEVCAHR